MDIYEEKRKAQNDIIQRLKQNEPLLENMLEIALNSIKVCFRRSCRGTDSEDNFSIFLNNMTTKITAGQSLSEYEIYVMDDLISSIDYEERKKERKSRGGSYSHVTRCLKNNKPLTGKTLELALDLVAVHGDDEQSKLIRNIGVKISTGQPLDEYEYHLVVDVLMLHAKLG